MPSSAHHTPPTPSRRRPAPPPPAAPPCLYSRRRIADGPALQATLPNPFFFGISPLAIATAVAKDAAATVGRCTVVVRHTLFTTTIGARRLPCRRSRFGAKSRFARCGRYTPSTSTLADPVMSDSQAIHHSSSFHYGTFVLKRGVLSAIVPPPDWGFSLLLRPTISCTSEYSQLGNVNDRIGQFPHLGGA